MTKLVYLAILVNTLLVSPLWADAGSLNLLPNAGFEEVGQDGWAVGWERWPDPLPSASTITVDANISHSGSRSLRISHTAFVYTRARLEVPVKPNTRYMIRCWIRGSQMKRAESGAIGPLLYVDQNHGGGRAFAAPGPGRKVSPTFGWTQYESEPIDTGETTKLIFMPYLHKATGTVWYDDIELIEVTPDLAQRLEQRRARAVLLHDLDAVERPARRIGDKETLAEVIALRQQIESAMDLPTTFARRQGPPFFPLHEDVYRLMAQLLGNKYGAVELVVSLADPFERQECLTYPAPAGPKGKVTIEGLRNDTEQIAVNLTNTTQETITARLTLTGAAKELTTKWRKVIPVELRDGIMIGDALPLASMENGAAVVGVPAGMTRQMWLQIDTGDRPGQFNGTISVMWNTHKSEHAFDVMVHNLAFPKQWPVNTFSYAYLNVWDMTKDRIEQAAADLAAHHHNTWMQHRWRQALPMPVFDEAGNLLEDKLDWSAFDTALAYSTYARTIIFWTRFHEADMLKAMAGGKDDLVFASPQWEERAIIWTRAMVKGLKARGIGYDRMAWQSEDEPSGPKVDIVVAVGRMLHKADPKIRVFSNFYESATLDEVQRMNEVVDLWSPDLPCLDKSYQSVWSGQDKEVWSYHPTGKGTTPQHIRGVFWSLFGRGITGYSFWGYADATGSPWDPYDDPQHDFAVVYDGDERELIPSKRWEAWREGVEDYTLLWMAQRRDDDSARQLIEKCKALAANISAARTRALRGELLDMLGKTP